MRLYGTLRHFSMNFRDIRLAFENIAFNDWSLLSTFRHFTRMRTSITIFRHRKAAIHVDDGVCLFLHQFPAVVSVEVSAVVSV